jgi:putative transposase
VMALREEMEERQAMLREVLDQGLMECCRPLIGRTLEELMKAEQDQVLGYRPHERLPQGQRADHRNGYYHRDVAITGAVLRGVAVPRSRRGSYQTKVLPRYQRRTKEVDDLLRQMFLGGGSTREVARMAEQLTGEPMSPQTVSRLCEPVAEAARAFHRRPVDFLIAPKETKEHWLRFLENLHLRGLHGSRLRCITTDGNPGLIAALQIVYPAVPRQRCWVHKMRNVTNQLKCDQRAEAKAGMARIYSASNRAQALAEFRRWYAHWHPLDAQAADCLKRDLEALLTVFDLPRAHRIVMRTTNPLERAFVEVRRRSRLFLAFNNQDSCEKLCMSAFGRLQASWNRKPVLAITQKT